MINLSHYFLISVEAKRWLTYELADDTLERFYFLEKLEKIKISTYLNWLITFLILFKETNEKKKEDLYLKSKKQKSEL